LRLDVSIDAPLGITHEHCRAVSRGIEDRLNEDDFYDRLQAVDVSSPGAETPVRFLWQLTKHVGRAVRVIRADGSVVEGTLLRADETGLDVQPKTKERSKQPEPPASIPASDIKEARTIITI
jgi:ribosome maturation factor RimP